MNEKITTFERVHEEVERRAQNCFDELVPVNAVSFENLKTMRIGLDEYRIEETAARQIQVVFNIDLKIGIKVIV